jgi:hypothetical protein
MKEKPISSDIRLDLTVDINIDSYSDYQSIIRPRPCESVGIKFIIYNNATNEEPNYKVSIRVQYKVAQVITSKNLSIF